MSNIFRDWVALMLYTLARDEEKYLELMGRYRNDREKGEREADLFAQAYGVLMTKLGRQREMGENPKELLGDCYMELAGKYSTKSMGQFFTPQSLCDMMAELTL